MTIIAHRGASGEELENTMQAFRRAYALGCRWIECDVRITRDGIPVIIHDATVNRTTNGRGRVSRITYRTLLSLDAGQGERIPSLEETLQFANKNSMRLVLEIKDPRALTPTLQAIKHVPSKTRIIISSFFPSVLTRASAFDHSLTTALIISRPRMHWVHAAHRVRARLIHVEASLATKKNMKTAHAAGLKVWAWTVNDLHKAARLKSLGVQGIFTDFPNYY